MRVGCFSRFISSRSFAPFPSNYYNCWVDLVAQVWCSPDGMCKRVMQARFWINFLFVLLLIYLLIFDLFRGVGVSSSSYFYSFYSTKILIELFPLLGLLLNCLNLLSFAIVNILHRYQIMYSRVVKFTVPTFCIQSFNLLSLPRFLLCFFGFTFAVDATVDSFPSIMAFLESFLSTILSVFIFISILPYFLVLLLLSFPFFKRHGPDKQHYFTISMC